MIGIGIGPGFGGSLPFSPRNISGLALWLRADKGVTIATGVSSWADQSGNGNTATQATGSAQPTRNASDASYNNQATLSFASAASQFLATGATPSLSQPFSIVVVGNDSGAAAIQALADDKAATLYFANNGSGHYYLSGGLNVTTNAAASNTPKVLIATINGASTTIRLSAATPDVTGNIGAATLTGVSIGCIGNGVSGFLNGKIAEVAVYSKALSVAEVAAINNYANKRYGISIGA